MRPRSKMRDQYRTPKRRLAARRTKPTQVSSHPEIEEEIDRLGCALDESRLKVETPRPTRKPIVSVDGCDVKGKPFRKDRAA